MLHYDIMDFTNFRLTTRLEFDAKSIEQIYTKLSKIDAVKQSWYVTGQLLPQILDKLTHGVIVTSAGASNRIEGNLLSDDEIESLYKNLKRG